MVLKGKNGKTTGAHPVSFHHRSRPSLEPILQGHKVTISDTLARARLCHPSAD